MTEVYELVQEGDLPITLDETKAYLKITNTADDLLIRDLMRGAVNHAERYSGRAFRVNDWALLLDYFPVVGDLSLRRSPVDTTSVIVQYTLSDVLTPVASSVYQVKTDVWETVLCLKEDQEWPTDGDDIEQGIRITFSTQAYEAEDIWKVSMLKHIIHMYENRGDTVITDSGYESGANKFLDAVSIPRMP